MKELLKALRVNKKALERTYKKIKELNPDWVVDSVNDYRTGYAVPLRIEGYNTHECDRLVNIYKKQAEELLHKICYAETYIDSIADDTDRLIFRLIYVDGLRYCDVAQELGYSLDSIKKHVINFWRNQQNDPH